MLPGELQPLYWKTWNSQKLPSLYNFKKILNPAYKELKENTEIIILSMNSSKQEKK